MIKLLLMLDDFLYIAVIIGLIIYALSLRRRMAGLNDPRLWLSKKERREYARKQLENADEERELARFEKNLELIQGKTTHREEIR